MEQSANVTRTIPRGAWAGAPEAAGERGPLCEAAVRLIDVALSAALLIALGPLMLLIAALVKLTSPGPVLFRHVRTGKNHRRGGGCRAADDRRTCDLFGRPFVFYKFRSMYWDARDRFPDLYRYEYSGDELRSLPIKVLVGGKDRTYRRGSLSGPDERAFQDPRVTRVGAWLRRTSLDELPNFLNVLKGDMHLVGPRPDIYENIRYCRPEHLLKLRVKPGITGLAQIRGRGGLSFHEINEYDVQYVVKRSLWLDLRILLRTIPDAIKGQGAV